MSGHLDPPVSQDLAIPGLWRAALEPALDGELYQELCEFVQHERDQHMVFPPQGQVFTALDMVAPDEVRVVILGQDPYHGEGQAHGLAFSVLPGVKPPPSLKNIFVELEADVGVTAKTPCLTAWAEQGVLLLNTVLTVRESEPNSHQRKGWEAVTDAVIQHLSQQETPIVFILWGKPAEKKAGHIEPPHVMLKSAHPSPLSARRGFFGSRPFSAANRELEAAGLQPIDWSLPAE